MVKIRGLQSSFNSHTIYLSHGSSCQVSWTNDMARQFFEDVKAANVAMKPSFAVMRLDRARFVPVYSDYSSGSRALRSLMSLVHGFFLFLLCGYLKYEQIQEKISYLRGQEAKIVPEIRLAQEVERLQADLSRLAQDYATARDDIKLLLEDREAIEIETREMELRYQAMLSEQATQYARLRLGREGFGLLCK